MNDSIIPPHIQRQIAAGPNGSRHDFWESISLQLVGQQKADHRISDQLIFDLLRERVPDGDKKDKELWKLIKGAHERNPQPAITGVSQGTSTGQQYEKPEVIRIKPLQASGKRVTLPSDVTNYTPADVLSVVAQPDDLINITSELHGAGKVMTLQEWRREYEAHPEHFSGENGIYYCFNPFVHRDADTLNDSLGLEGDKRHKIARCDENVEQYRYLLVELEVPKPKRAGMTDEQKQAKLEEFYGVFVESELPFKAIYTSADVSLHGIVKLNMTKRRDFDAAVALIYDYFSGMGEYFDKSNKNASRLSRLPGAYRNGRKQTLLALDVGALSFEAWREVKFKEVLERTYGTQDTEEFPTPMGDAAFCGPIGEIINAVSPHTEANREALLLQALVAFGNMIGRSAWINAGGKHFANDFLIVAGATGRGGRKGTGLRIIEEAFKRIDEAWADECQLKGIQSGEGIIHSIRDAKYGIPKGKKGEEALGEELLDEGVADKRKLIVEEEFAQILTVSGRQENTTTVALRDSWDSKNKLQNASKNNGQVASNPHVSVIGHITREEFKAKTSKRRML